MDYVVGSVAALISGNVTPNRPKLIRRALTPTKHQTSPNVTPKSDLQVDRSIFLSPTLQKKKAVAKKSPKRIFQNPELDTTANEDGSPKADKVKKHLKDDLEADTMGKSNKKSPKKGQKSSLDSSAPLEMFRNDSVVTTENSPKKKKKRNSGSCTHDQFEISNVDSTIDIPQKDQSPTKSLKKKNHTKSVVITENPAQIIESSKSDDITESTEEATNNTQDNNKKKNKKHKNNIFGTNNVDNKENKTEIIQTETQPTKKKKNKKNKNKNKHNQVADENKPETTETEVNTTETIQKSKKTNKKQLKTKINEIETMETDEEITETINPNAITEQDSDSEHDSDDEIHSENEESNKELLESQENDENSDESGDDDDEKQTKKGKLPKKEQKALKDKKKKGDGENIKVRETEINLEDEAKKTIFVGNVPLTKKTRKEIKKIFRKYGEIKTVRIRFVPVKDARVTPKMAVIKNELHPERSTVNAYVKFADEASVEQALAENNTVLNGYHLRVTRTTSTGAEHDPRLAIFVGNMPFGMEDDQLRAVFEKCGQIESVRIVRDKKTNAGKGFGYVNFTSKDGVELALNLSEEDLTVKNRIMRVKRSTQVLGQKGPGQNRPRQNKPGQNRPWQDRPGQNRPPQNRPGQNRPWQDIPGQNRPIQNRPWQDRPGQNRPWQDRQGQNRPWQDRSGPNEPIQDRGEDGAHRRIINKRKYQESSDPVGPPNKKQKNINQPNNRENKKQRKEFVGMTSEKKKKHKFDKGQKKKKVLSEILSKKRS